VLIKTKDYVAYLITTNDHTLTSLKTRHYTMPPTVQQLAEKHTSPVFNKTTIMTTTTMT